MKSVGSSLGSSDGSSALLSMMKVIWSDNL